MSTLYRPALSRHAARAASLLLAGALVSGAAVASPQPGTDPLAGLIEDRGLAAPFVANPNPGHLLPAGTAPAVQRPATFAQQVRESASGMVVSAMNFLGVRYVRGGDSAEEGFDCSGFTRHVFENSIGLILPRRADEQATAPGLVKVRREELQPGDLVFFNTLRRTFSHVGIYVGEGKFIHAPRSGGNVRVENMRVSYWAKRFTGARRVADKHLTVAATPLPSSQPAMVHTSAPATPPAFSAATENHWN
ncbi:C40 family peptidase [Rhizobacter sp. LjRoot28]|uniref:C40 family peptidase n=1 Tax=Rhizobacter sp. LjRoot28 TaxID=3342309 RepID=UPI003F504BB1